MTPRSSETILRDLANVMAATFPDRDPPLSIDAKMRLFGDLGLASIDVVVLGERLEQYYSRRLPFGSFLADLRKRGAEDLALGDLIEFLQQHAEPV